MEDGVIGTSGRRRGSVGVGNSEICDQLYL